MKRLACINMQTKVCLVSLCVSQVVHVWKSGVVATEDPALNEQLGSLKAFCCCSAVVPTQR